MRSLKRAIDSWRGVSCENESGVNMANFNSYRYPYHIYLYQILLSTLLFHQDWGMATKLTKCCYQALWHLQCCRFRAWDFFV